MSRNFTYYRVKYAAFWRQNCDLKPVNCKKIVCKNNDKKIKKIGPRSAKVTNKTAFTL